VIYLLLPLVEAENGGLTRLWWMLAAAVPLLAAFARWEVRTVRAERQPLLDPGWCALPATRSD
jgi:hypothetical protein